MEKNEQKIPSLVDLVRGNYPAETVLEVFSDYVKNKATIRFEDFREIFDKTPFTPVQLWKAHLYMEEGATVHAKSGIDSVAERAEAGEYLAIREYIARRINLDILNQKINMYSSPTVRIRNTLIRAGIETYGELVNCSKYDLLSYKNFGELSLKQLNNWLKEKGLALKEEF
jgi:hypothetical protein